MEAQRIIKTYDTGNLIASMTRKMDESKMKRKGYIIESEEKINKYSGMKGFILFLIFAPLAFLGGTKKIRVTYVKQIEEKKN